MPLHEYFHADESSIVESDGARASQNVLACQLLSHPLIVRFTFATLPYASRLFCDLDMSMHSA